MYLPERELVPCARSSFSQSTTERPLPAASRAMPAPLMPPPMIRRSTVPGFAMASAPVDRRLTREVSPHLLGREPRCVGDGLDRGAGDVRCQGHILEP